MPGPEILLLPLPLTALALFAIVLLRYALFAGGLHWLCAIRNREAWRHRRIDPRPPEPAMIRTEIRWSVLTSAIFALAGTTLLAMWQAGLTRIYVDVAEYGWAYFAFSIVAMALIHETYFYWTHRWLHHPALFRSAHRVHHLSRNPTAWAAFSFHPIEGVIEALILPALVVALPVHPAALLAFLMFMTVMSVVNHSGYELYPAGFDGHPVTGWWISATHHQHHHRAMRGNYGLYFTFWDRLMGTQRSGREASLRPGAIDAARGLRPAPLAQDADAP